jgi:hypothetical protein
LPRRDTLRTLDLEKDAFHEGVKVEIHVQALQANLTQRQMFVQGIFRLS